LSHTGIVTPLYTKAILKNILAALPTVEEKSGPKIVGWPLFEQNKNVPPY